MGHDGHFPAERVINLGLPGSVVEMVIAANDMGNAHVMVVDDDRQHIGRRTVGPEQNEVVEIFILPCNASLHLILNDGFAGQWSLKPDHWVNTCRYVLGIAVTAAPVVEPCEALRARFFSHRGEFVGAAVTTIRVSGSEQLLGDLAVTGGP